MDKTKVGFSSRVNMEVSKKKYGLAIVLCCLLAFTSGYALQNYGISKPHQPSRQGANVFLTIESDVGVYDLQIGNVITDIGENQTSYAHGGNALNVSWISIGNATAGVSLTKLTTEYDRDPVDSIVYGISGGDYNRNVTRKFTFTETVTLNCAGVQWLVTAGSDNNLFACADFTTQTTFALDWNLTITWAFVFDDN